MVDWLVARGQTRGRASAITVGGGFLVVTAIMVLTLLSLVDQAEALADGVTLGIRSVNDAAGGRLGLLSDGVAGGARHAVELLVALGESAATQP